MESEDKMSEIDDILQKNDKFNYSSDKILEEPEEINNSFQPDEKEDKLNDLSSQLKNEINKNKDLSIQLNEEKNLNDKLRKEIEELKLKIESQNQSLNNNIESNKINISNEKLISIIISSMDEKILYSIICKSTDTTSNLEKELYKEYPELSNINHIFLYNGKEINKFETLESNKIKNGYTLILCKK